LAGKEKEHFREGEEGEDGSGMFQGKGRVFRQLEKKGGTKYRKKGVVKTKSNQQNMALPSKTRKGQLSDEGNRKEEEVMGKFPKRVSRQKRKVGSG